MTDIFLLLSKRFLHAYSPTFLLECQLSLQCGWAISFWSLGVFFLFFITFPYLITFLSLLFLAFQSWKVIKMFWRPGMVFTGSISPFRCLPLRCAGLTKSCFPWHRDLHFYSCFFPKAVVLSTQSMCGPDPRLWLLTSISMATNQRKAMVQQSNKSLVWGYLFVPSLFVMPSNEEKLSAFLHCRFLFWETYPFCLLLSVPGQVLSLSALNDVFNSLLCA
jgi:hypothetical protein